MSDEKTYTARDLILAKRQGYAARMWESLCMTEAEVRATIAARYPLPKITRPRVVRDEYDTQWRVRVDGEGGIAVEFRHADSQEWSVQRAMMTRNRIRLWADLLANPTEEVDDAD